MALVATTTEGRGRAPESHAGIMIQPSLGSTGVRFWDTTNEPDPLAKTVWENRSRSMVNPVNHTRPTTLGAVDFARKLGADSDDAKRRMSELQHSVVIAQSIPGDPTSEKSAGFPLCPRMMKRY